MNQDISSTTIKLAIIGLGNVGRAFTEQLLQRRAWLQDTFGIEPQVIGVADRSGAVVDRNGLDVMALARIKVAGGKLVDAIGESGASPSEIIDHFAAAGAQVIIETLPSNLPSEGEPAITFVTAALTRGLHVVTANKA